MSEGQRIDWIDSVKGIGIVLVYIGHCYIPAVNGLIYSFHMPLFFIISGFLWNTGKYQKMTIKDFVEKKIKAYIIPYLKMALICFVIWGLIYGMFQCDNINGYFHKIWQYTYGILLVYPRSQYMPACFPLWFLVALFFAEILYFFANKTKVPVLLILLFTIIGYGFSKIIKLPFSIDCALSLVSFLYIGNQIRRHWGKVHYKSLMISVLAGGVILACLLHKCYSGVDFAINRYNTRVFLWAPIVSLLLFIIIQRVGKLRIIIIVGRVLGRNTMALMGYNITFNMIAGFISLQSGTWARAFFVVPMGIGLAFLLYKYPKMNNYIQ